MGAWGYNPLENDAALDWFYDIENALHATIDRDEPEQLIAGAFVCMHLKEADNLVSLQELSEEFIKSLNSIDDEWFKAWDEPELMRSKVASLKAGL